MHSHAGFSLKHVVGTFRGNFKEFAATLTAADGEATLTGRAPVASVAELVSQAEQLNTSERIAA